MSVKLLIADDHEVVRCGLRSLIANTEIDIVGEAATGEQAIQLAMDLNPDVVLLDIRMPGGDGLNALGRLKLERPDLAILMLSTYDNPTYVARAVALGAAGYVLKGANRDKLLNLPCLHVDTGDAELDEELSGYMDVIVGLNHRKMMPVE